MSEKGGVRQYWVPPEELGKIVFRPPETKQTERPQKGEPCAGHTTTSSDSRRPPPAKHAQNEAAAIARSLHASRVWLRLVNVFAIPVDVVTALFTSLAQFYSEQQVLQLFEESERGLYVGPDRAP